jgi:acyl carrier protein
MDEQEKRLAACFLAVFPEIAPEEIQQATSASVESWDSVAVVTLLAVVEEEFGISIDVEDPSRFDSFKNILGYLQEASRRTSSSVNGRE